MLLDKGLYVKENIRMLSDTYTSRSLNSDPTNFKVKLENLGSEGVLCVHGSFDRETSQIYYS